MKLLHVIAWMNPEKGGVCAALRTMAAGLSDLGVENEVACLDMPGSPFLNDSPFPVHALGPGKGPWQYNARLKDWLSIHLVRFDAVIVHGLWLYHGFALRKAFEAFRSRLLSKPGYPKLFVMPHGMLDPYFQYAPGRGLKAIRNVIYWKLVENRLIHEADQLLYTTEEEQRLAEMTFSPFHPKGQTVAGLGVSAPPPSIVTMQWAFGEKCPGLQGSPYLLFLSRIHEKKGVDMLIKAYASLQRQYSQKASRQGTKEQLPKLVIAGPGLEDGYGRHLQQTVRETKELQGSVFFTGMLTGEAKWGAFYGCEALVLPSHQENFGIAVVEALACGKPVLISRQVNIWREITTANAGIIADDTLSGTTALLELWTHLTGREKLEMSNNASGLYKNCFARPLVCRRLLNIISTNYLPDKNGSFRINENRPVKV